jgi:hypothetical protein
MRGSPKRHSSRTRSLRSANYASPCPLSERGRTPSCTVSLRFFLRYRFCLQCWQSPFTLTRTTKSQHGATPGDAQIEAIIRTKLAKSKIGKDDFTFRVQRGVVTWEGSTNVMQHEGSATRMARTAGAARVINNIQVSATAKANATSNLKKASVQP